MAFSVYGVADYVVGREFLAQQTHQLPAEDHAQVSILYGGEHVLSLRLPEREAKAEYQHQHACDYRNPEQETYQLGAVKHPVASARDYVLDADRCICYAITPFLSFGCATRNAA